MSAAWPGQVHRRAGREPGSCLAPRPGVSRAASDRSRRRRESPGGARARGGRLGSMSQQRPARKLPSPLMDPAEETMRRRCRDPINVESLLVSPADGLGPERRGPWRGVGRAGPVRSDRVASQAQPPLPFRGEAGLSVFGVGSPPPHPGLGRGRSSVSSALALPVTDCEPNPPFPSTPTSCNTDFLNVSSALLAFTLRLRDTVGESCSTLR